MAVLQRPWSTSAWRTKRVEASPSLCRLPCAGTKLQLSRSTPKALKMPPTATYTAGEHPKIQPRRSQSFAEAPRMECQSPKLGSPTAMNTARASNNLGRKLRAGTAPRLSRARSCLNSISAIATPRAGGLKSILSRPPSGTTAPVLRACSKQPLHLLGAACLFLDEDTLAGRSPEEIFARCLEAAKNGDDEAMCRVALMRLQGEGTERDLDAAFAWLDKAMEAENATAFGVRGSLLTGRLPGLPPTSLDGYAAIELYERAEAKGFDFTEEKVSTILLGLGGVTRDAPRCVALLQDAFARSHVIPQYKAMADLQATLFGPETHEAGSKEASDAAVAAGKPFRMSIDEIRRCHFYYAVMTEARFGLPYDAELAKRHYSAAADRVAIAAARLAELELDQSQSNPGEAIEAAGEDGLQAQQAEVLGVYTAQAEEHEPFAQYFLAQAYEHGALGLEADLQQASDLYTRAASCLAWAQDDAERLAQTIAANSD
eukprot:m.67140 g.67140  ORF g.67140 m.67140 type:complete len:487 (+) comp7656_c0_seq1:646-2106(+)